MPQGWDKILLGGLGALVAFKGLDLLTKPKSRFSAEDWSGSQDDIPIAVDYFCALEVLKNNGKMKQGKKGQYQQAVKMVQNQITKGAFPFLIFNRKQTVFLMNLINDRLIHYNEKFHSEGRKSVEKMVEMLKPRLMQVSSKELNNYFAQQALKVELRGLPPLPQGTTNNGVRVRFAPNPNGPLSMGHSFGIIVNNTYAKAYNGDYILRFDDTDPDQKRPLRELYPQIIEEFEFLTDRTEDDYELHIASENKERYISLARQLISEGKAYVSCIPHKIFAEEYQQYLTPEEIAEGKTPLQSAQAKSNPDREKSIETNLKQFDEMVETGSYVAEDGTLCSPTQGHFIKIGQEAKVYEEVGTIVPTVYLKTPLDTGKSKWRDIKIMRATARSHPNETGFVWPYLAFQGAIDDHDLRITHMIRGSDLWETEEAYPFIWNALGWDLSGLPTFLYWPRLFFKDFSIPYTDLETGDKKYLKAIGTSKMALLIANQPEFQGNWCNPLFPTVCSYMAKGYPASYLQDFWLEDVWGQTFPFFNGEKIAMKKDGKVVGEIPALSKIMSEAKISMREGAGSLGAKPNYRKNQAQVPYPLTKDGGMRGVPTITPNTIREYEPRPIPMIPV